MAEDEELNGASILANALKEQGVEYMFGVVGLPIIEVAFAAQAAGIKYIGMRNEQAASYAASALGYLTGRPAVCLVVPGPGLVHAFAGMSNAMVNCWPMIVVAGSSDQDQIKMEAFQEYQQMETSYYFSKYTAQMDSLVKVPYLVEQAVRQSIYGRPGVSYLEFPGNLVTSTINTSKLLRTSLCPNPPRQFADPALIKQALSVLAAAEKPLVIIGKRAAYGRAEKELLKFITLTRLPFLPTPMGKGVVPDNHPFCVSPARSRALLQADVILLLGARLNWILHFGHPPRYLPNVKVIQVDICPEEIGTNVRPVVPLVGDVTTIVSQLNNELENRPIDFHCKPGSPWWHTLQEKIHQNQQTVKAMIEDIQVPMNYYAAYGLIQKLLPKDCLIVNEGANTMDIGRTMLANQLPRHRLDAGTFGTMGVGVGFAIAAAIWCRDNEPTKRVVCVQGDSAFGFSGMELETVSRYKLPIIFIVFNNNGIYAGLDEDTWKILGQGDLMLSAPPTCLSPSAHYEHISTAFGGAGYYAQTPEELQTSLRKAIQETDRMSLINLAISPNAQRKTQEFDWLTRSSQAKL